MSIVQENACGVNFQLDRLQQQLIRPDKLPRLYEENQNQPSHRVHHLQNVVSSISLSSKTQSLLSANRLIDLLSDPDFPRQPLAPPEVEIEEHVSDYLWLVAAKAAIQASGLVMNTLLQHTLQLQEETAYWNEALGSVWYSGLYAAQTSPMRLWHWTREIYFEQAVQRVAPRSMSRSVAARWAQFYQIARQSMSTVSDHSVRLNLSSPLQYYRSEIRQKRDFLLSLKDIHTSSLGLLMGGWQSLQAEDFIPGDSHRSHQQWQEGISRIVILTEAILLQVGGQSSTSAFEQQVFATIEKDMASMQVQSGDSATSPVQKPMELIQRLVNALRQHLPSHTVSVSALIDDRGRPSGVVRYWLPLSVAFLSSSASVRFLAHRQKQITQWIVDIGATIIDFGGNWVVDPIRKLVGTIRHDEKSEIAIMSKNSLVADQASLERMVIDFVRDRPDPGNGSLTVDDTTAIANAVKEGDLTPVLRAYERDLRAPFAGTVRGDLVRALLIQIQKTKVDVEIAIGGINALLKSQELVFGFVGLTPGILVSYATLQWLTGLFGSRRGLQKGKQRHGIRRGLRNITRVLTSASLSHGIISYKDSGRLLFEAEALLEKVRSVLGGVQYWEFREDIQDLLNVQTGAEQQLRVVERIRWTYFQ
ncbi:uncharacterized protein N7459_006114 [Penicillium hispanicum]|uniref:uncharacterized protein n=1 Tax=Penicillium hispanicum TaxID=1080232 RepID=UPI0025411AB5|nr:uncharacterized protein N7459_006114 [Penicillium hispanicum]KAJ5580129.1 hypothetical protein N7459_006114 [Penicillium hispanicum]